MISDLVFQAGLATCEASPGSCCRSGRAFFGIGLSRSTAHILL